MKNTLFAPEKSEKKVAKPMLSPPETQHITR